jgi:hypothetical protein
LGLESLVSAFIAAQAGRLQIAAAGKMMRVSAESVDDAAKVLEAARQNFDRLANVAAGIGGNLDISI